MQKNFGGKQFIIPETKSEPSIDCMFFPASHGDQVLLDPEEIRDSIFAGGGTVKSDPSRKSSNASDYVLPHA